MERRRYVFDSDCNEVFPEVVALCTTVDEQSGPMRYPHPLDERRRTLQSRPTISMQLALAKTAGRSNWLCRSTTCVGGVTGILSALDDNVTGTAGRETIQPRERLFMLQWTLMFLVVALIAGVLGFGGIAGAAAGIAKILFFIFLVLFLVSLIQRNA
jgi:uncharacterized membrane protein YtjA (UPF0391 family)